MSSQSHLPHWRVLPPGEFNVMIPEIRAETATSLLPALIQNFPGVCWLGEITAEMLHWVLLRECHRKETMYHNRIYFQVRLSLSYQDTFGVILSDAVRLKINLSVSEFAIAVNLCRVP